MSDPMASIPRGCVNEGGERDQAPCEHCVGEGRVWERETVTMEMAIDAGDRSLAGMVQVFAFQCPACNGYGESDD